MRKNLFYAIALACCTLGFFTACDDDDDSSSDWSSLSGTYSDNSLDLMMGELTIPVDGKSVTLAATSSSAATLTLTNVIPESSDLSMDVTLSATGDGYTLTGSTSINDCAVTVNGTVSDGNASIVYDRSLTSDIVGEWTLASGTNAVYANLSLGDAQMDALGAMVGPLVSSLIWTKVSSVDVSLGSDGLFGVSWTKVDETEATDISTYLNSFGIQYCVISGNYFIVIDKAYIELTETLLESFASDLLDSYGISVDTILAFFQDLGGYYGLPLSYTIDGDSATFYMGTEAIQGLLTVASPYLTGLIPEAYQTMVSSLLALLPYAETLEFGLNMTR